MQLDVSRFRFKSVAGPRERLHDDRFKPTQAGWQVSLVAVLAYAGVMWLLIAYLPSDIFDSTSHIFILSIGVIGLWRYGWWFTHYARCILYRRVVFPKLRRAARSEEHPSELPSLMPIPD